MFINIIILNIIWLLGKKKPILSVVEKNKIYGLWCASPKTTLICEHAAHVIYTQCLVASLLLYSRITNKKNI